MIEIKVEVTKYIAEDGTRFDDKESCAKYDEECKIASDACASRIEMIRNKRRSLDDEAARIQREKELKLAGLEEQILSMKNRIRELIEVGYEFHKNNFKTNNCVWVSAEKVGFLKNQRGDVTSVAMCIDKWERDLDKLYPSLALFFSTWCAFYVYTDGETIKYKFTTRSGCERITEMVIDVKIELCKKFIQKFEEFESEFYEDVDSKMK